MSARNGKTALIAMTVGPDGELTPEKQGRQYSAEDEEYANGKGEGAYTYDELTKKDPVPFVPVPKTPLYTSNGKLDRLGIAEAAKANSTEQVLPGGRKQHFVFVKDIGENVLIPQKGIVHGMVGKENKPTTINTVAVTAALPQILENSIAINERNPREEKPEDGAFSYIMLGLARDENGNDYLVKSTVVHRDDNVSGIDGVEIYNLLKGSKGRKIGADVMGGTAGFNPAAYSRASAPDMTVAELLKLVNQNYPEFLPINVREKFKSRVEPAERIRYSAESDGDDAERETPDTPALQKLGVKIAGSKGRYGLTEQLLARDKAAKQLMKATKKAEQKLKYDRLYEQYRSVQTDASNAAQSQYLLGVMGKWVANPSATA